MIFYRKPERLIIDVLPEYKNEEYEHTFEVTFLVPEKHIEKLRQAIMKLIEKEK